MSTNRVYFNLVKEFLSGTEDIKFIFTDGTEMIISPYRGGCVAKIFINGKAYTYTDNAHFYDSLLEILECNDESEETIYRMCSHY